MDQRRRRKPRRSQLPRRTIYKIPRIENIEPCPISGEKIDNIFIAITDPDTKKPARFDKVLEMIAQRETLERGQFIAYIGAGNFGVLERSKSGRKIIIIRKIPFEDNKELWRKNLSPGISNDYTPEPEPLENLYTAEEVKAFPRFTAVSHQ